jgi:HemK-related putative methylase
LIACLLFGYCPRPRHSRAMWDFTSLALRKGLLRAVSDGDAVLEIGTGDVGLLSIFLARHRPHCSMTAVDIDPRFVTNARANAKAGGLNITIHCSDLFTSVSGKYDVIFFNPPYVPTGHLDLERERSYRGTGDHQTARRISDGGPDGLDLVRRYLREARQYLLPGGRILLGINLYHVPGAEVRCLVESCGYSTQETLASRYSESVVWILTATGDGRS